ncbi:putative Zn-dependent protease [Rhodanobacter sp. K2T2]|uniref:matrixin family metalloprotease n=1 Tax=Rhodanobacter sp. K2T2 TaxID=2723085 RepID=UPI0015CB12E6|nr:matrixin family metalloprotease [Rhodanobacter sp. K2T2]NYE27416.1 putative Zn-dependent protease [Rhodanobacter sp. K2T2]
MTNPTINESAFSASTNNSSAFTNLLSTFNYSPVLVNYINSFTSYAGNTIVIGAAGSGSSTAGTTNGNLTITLDPSYFSGPNQLTPEQIGIVFAHELGHAEDSNGLYSDYSPTSPASAANDDAQAEGVASVASYNVANDFNNYNVLNNVNSPTLYANNIQAFSSAISSASANGLSAEISAAGAVISSENPSTATNITYFQFWEDGYAISACDSSSTINNANLNNATINWSAVTPSNLNVQTNSDGSWSVSSSNIFDKSGDSLTINGSENASGNLTCIIDKTSSMNSLSSYLTGEDITDAISNATVQAAPDSQSIIAGSNNSINSGFGAVTTLQGNNNNIALTGGTVDTADNDTSEVFNGSNFTLNASGLLSGTATGMNDIFNLAASSGSTLGISGTADVANSVGNTIQLDGAGSAATVAGADTVDLNAANQKLTLSTTGDTVDTIASDTGEAITGSGLTLDGTGLFSGVVTGTNDTFNLAASSGSTLGISGTGDVANSVGNTIQLDGASSAATVAGADTVDLEAANQALTLSKTGDTVDTIASDTGEAITGSGLTLDGTGLFSGVVTGSNDVFNLAASSGSTLGISGTADVANSVGNTIQLDGASSTATVAGADTVDLQAANQTLTLNSTSGDTVDAVKNDTDETIDGSGFTLNGASGLTGYIGGSNDTLNLVSNSGTSLGLIGGGDTVNSIGNAINLGAAGSSADVVGSGNTLGLESTGQSLTASSGNTIDTSANSTGDLLSCTSDTIDGGSGFSALISGTNNTINLTSNSGSGVELYGSGDTTNAVDDAVYLNAANLSDTVVGTGDKVGLNASGDILSMSSAGDTVDAAANSTGDLITGTSETIDGGSGFTGLISGTNNTINLTANSGSGVSLYSSGDTTNAVGDAVFLNAASIDETVTGAGDKVYLNTAGDQLTLSTSGDTVDTAANATGEIVAGSGETIDGASDYTGFIVGSNDTANLTSNSSSSIAFFGQNDVANSVGNNLYLAQAGDSGTVIGSDNTISLNASTQVLTVDTAGDTVSTAVNDTGETITATGDTIDGNTGFNGNVLGSNDTVSLDANSGSYVGVYGSNQTVDSTGNSINLAASASATINGVDTIGLCGVNDSLTLDSQGDTVNTLASDTGETITATDATVNGSTGSFSLNGNSNTFNDGSDASLNISGTGDNVSMGSGGYVGLVSGTSDTISLNSGTIVTLNNVGGTFDGSGNTISAGSGTFAIDGNSNKFGDGADTSINISGTGDTVSVGNGSYVGLVSGTSDTIDLTDGTIDTLNNVGGTVDGSGDTINAGTGNFVLDGNSDVFHGAADDPLSISGQNDTIYQSNATIDITGNDTTTIDGSNDKIVGGSGDKFTITGTDDDVSATDSSVAFDGTNTGDDVVGASDTGSNWAAPDPDDGSGDGGYGGYSGGGDGGGDGGYGYGFVKWKGRSPDAAKVAKYAGASQGSVYEQASWADKTVTWSFAQGNQAAQSSDPFSSYINAPKEEAAVEEAFQAWAKASGLNFVEVPDSAASDIRVGFGDLNTSTSNVIGLTNYTSTNGQLNAGAVVRLEDPSQTALVAGSNGQLVYGSTDASLEQVALHEIGHALGLADNGNADSVMDYLLSSSNQSLSATDVAGIQSLYGSGSSSSPPSSSMLGVNNQLHQLVQAMASFDAGDGAWESSDPLVPAMHHTASLAATSAMSSHLARVA